MSRLSGCGGRGLNRAKMRDRSGTRAQAHAGAPGASDGSLLGLGFATLVSLVDPDPRHKRMVLEILSGASAEGIGTASRRHLLGMAMVYGPLAGKQQPDGHGRRDELSQGAEPSAPPVARAGPGGVDAGSETAGHLFLFVLGLVRSGQSAALEPANDDPEKEHGKEPLPLAAFH